VVVGDLPPGFGAERLVIHLKRVSLPDGLRAVSYRDPHGNLVIYVSDALDARSQRAAIREVIRASRRALRRGTGLLPVGAALFLGIRVLLGRAVRVIGLPPAALGAAATATVLGATAAGVFVLATPDARGPAATAHPPVAGAVRTPRGPAGGPSPGHRGRPVGTAHVAPEPGRPASSGHPRPAPTSTGRPSPGNPSPSPGPAPSPTVTQPAPSPSPSPTGSPPVCVIILGVRVCL
jgi:hypothetical protein